MAKKNHEITEICAFCEYAKCLHDESTMLCEKRGIVNSDYYCRRFVYDTLKRSPTLPPPILKFEFEEL